MKTKLSVIPFTCILAGAFTASVCAQPLDNAVVFSKPPVITAQTPQGDFDGHQFAMLYPLEIHVKAAREFTHSFKHAENVHWYKADVGVIVYFTENGIKTRAGYDSKGNMLYKMLSYDEMMLPREIRARVKSIYYDFSILWVNEITVKNQTVYLVQMKDKNTYKTIRVCEGEEMEVIEEYLKIQ